jgi:SAM-dependent MidA family methyltransferase
MQLALYDPDVGYYTRSDRKRWGREGDYRTSSERSELFAATFARYFARLYEELGRPAEWAIVEGGAGDRTFERRVLSELEEEHSAVFSATRYCVSEVQQEFKSNFSLYFSNELLDAFPVHLLTTEGELYVTLNSDGKFAWSIGSFSTPRLGEFLDRYSIKLAPGQIIEVNLAIDDWLAGVASQLKYGYLITVDYGAEQNELYDPILRPNGTLRGFSRHGFVDDVLSAPGEYDITSSVNWTQVITGGERLGFEVVEFTSQDKFLLEAGLLEVLQQKSDRAATDSEKLKLATDAREMILPGGMASSFQVLVQKRR